MTDNSTVGKKIAQLRKQHKMTQDEFGEKIGVSRQAVASWEHDEWAPKSDKILEICRIFQIDSDYFYGNGAEEKIAATVDIIADANDTSGVKTETVIPLEKKRGKRKLKFVLLIIGWAIMLALLIAVISIVVLIVSSPNISETSVSIMTDSDRNLLIIGAVLGSLLFALLIIFTIKFFRNKKIKEIKNEKN